MKENNVLKKHKRIKIFTMIVGLFVIPIYSFLFGNNGDLVLMTFSQVGGRIDGKLEGLIIWGLICSVYFYFTIEYMLVMIKKKSHLVNGSLVLGCIALILTVYLPFNTMMYPASSEIHNNLARVAVAMIIIAALLFILTLKKFDEKVFLKGMIAFGFVVVILVLCFLKYEVSSIFQIFFASLMSYLLAFLFLIIEKSKNLNLEETLMIKERDADKEKLSNAFNQEVKSVFESEE